MQLKKLTSAALAAVVLTSSFTLATDVKAEDYKLDLLTVPFEEMSDALPDNGSSNRYSMEYIGKGCYSLSSSNNSCSIVRITDDDLDKWRTTGEFSYTKVNYDNSPIYNVDFDKGNFFSLYDGSNNQYNVYKLDEANNSIVKQSTVSSTDASKLARGQNNSIISYDGYSASFEVNNSDTQENENDKVITVTVTAPDGTTATSNLNYKNGNGNDYQIMLAYEGNVICYVYIKSGDNQGLYSIDKAGNATSVSVLSAPDTGTVGECYGDMTVYSNFIYFDGHNTNDGKRQAYFYGIENNKLYNTKLHDEATAAGNGKLNPWYSFSDKMYSGKVIATKNGSGASLCYIHDLENDKIYANTASDTTVTDVTKYFRITTTDGKIYRLSKGDSSWINSSGYGYFEGSEFKEVFNDYVISTDFVGDYAAVTVDEKTYLIDKSFNQVSESIDGNAWLAIGNELYNVWVDGKQSLMTYCDAKPTPSTGSTDSTGSTETYHPVTTTATEVIISETNDVKIEFAESVISKDTVLEVKEETITDTSVTFDISLKLDGKDVQPNGTVTVKIKKPDKLSGDKFYVYRIETDGSYTDMHAEYSDGYIIFKTDHFSEYIISTVQLSESTEVTTTTTVESTENTENTENTNNANSDDNLPTGNKVAAIIPIIAFASGMTAIIAYRRRK